MKNAMPRFRRAVPRRGTGHPPPRPSPGAHWLMLVRTRCTDPTRESEFNDWYDNIDIPDVLEVPGYLRARRGLIQPSGSGSMDDGGKYIALYDISSEAIDKTIIEMLMATRRMEQRGRSTDLLEVTERAYYRQQAPSYTGPSARAGQPYLFLERFGAERADAKFNECYGEACRRAAANVTGLIRVTRYELYRVLMIEPKALPKFLTLFEISALSSERARAALDEVAQAWRRAAPSRSGYVAGDAALFLKTRDEVRV